MNKSTFQSHTNRCERPWGLVSVALCLLAAASHGCQRASEPTPSKAALAEKATAPAARVSESPEKLAAPGLPNAYRIRPQVISGGLPAGDAAFRQLAEQGIKTIISVDGAQPDVELARRHGMRYVHLPHGYDGIAPERSQQLAKAVRDLPGPIYIHCHHGKHRSPAAAAVACVGAGLIDTDEALAVLATAGTSPNYRGLFAAVRQARRFDDKLLDALAADFPERAQLPPLAEAMVEIEQSFDHLKQIADARWQAPSDHPDLEPAHQALLLREQFTELLRTEETNRQPPSFRVLLTDSEAAAQQLEDTLRNPAADLDQAAAEAFNRINTNCTACHRAFRDIPLEERPASSATQKD